MLGPAPVPHPPCGWELRMAGVFPLGWQISVSPPCSGLYFSYPHTFCSLLISGEGFYSSFHCSAHHSPRDLTSLSYLISIFPSRREDSNLGRLLSCGALLLTLPNLSSLTGFTCTQLCPTGRSACTQ